ncbi:MAG: hypothetical protein BWY47_01408 [Bacteroidetes bacterium ADurb.Bin302]|nr:MAG: hypothetical protein BWY47_01408 [Bacteroidetes bacterium ADurb.Bin302]
MDYVLVRVTYWTQRDSLIDNEQVSIQAPADFIAQGDSFKVNLTWDNPETYDSVLVYRGTSVGTQTLLTRLANVESYSDTSLPHNRTYYYKLRGKLGGEYSDYTSVVSATTIDTTTAGNLPYYYQAPTITGDSLFVASWGTDDATGADSANALSLEGLNNKWGTIEPGDVIYFFWGDTIAPVYTTDDYQIPGNLSRIGIIRIPNGLTGDSLNWITFKPYGNANGRNKPYISDTNVTCYHQTVRSGGMAYVAFVNLKFRGEHLLRAQDSASVGLNNIRYISCDFNNNGIVFTNGYSLAYANFPEPNTGWAEMKNITVYDCAFYESSTSEGCINVTLPHSNFRFGYNKFYHPCEEALDIAGGFGHIIEYNFVSDATANGIKLHSQGSEFYNGIIRGNVILQVGRIIPATGLAMQNVRDCKVYNNTISTPYAAYFGNRDRGGTEGYFGNFQNNEIFNNIFDGCVQISGTWSGDVFNNGLPHSNQIDSIFYRNTFSNNTWYQSHAGYSQLRFWANTGYPDQTDTVVDSRSVPNVSTFSTEWNSKINNADANRDPLFVDSFWTSTYIFGDFSLSPTSYEVGDGIQYSGWTKNIYGEAVTNPPNRGAY